jgi:hypothetical protein
MPPIGSRFPKDGNWGFEIGDPGLGSVQLALEVARGFEPVSFEFRQAADDSRDATQLGFVQKGVDQVRLEVVRGVQEDDFGGVQRCGAINVMQGDAARRLETTSGDDSDQPARLEFRARPRQESLRGSSRGVVRPARADEVSMVVQRENRGV